MLIRQYFDSSLEVEWSNANPIFGDQPFSFSTPTRTQQVWIRNVSSVNYDSVEVSAIPIDTTLLPAADLKRWVKFGSTENDINYESLTVRLNAGQTVSYYIKVTVPASTLDDANLASIFPVRLLDFQARAIVESTTTTIMFAGENGLNHPDASFYRTRYTSDGVVLSDSPLSGSWSRIHNVTGVTPFRVTSIEVDGQTPSGTRMTGLIRRSATRLEADANANAPITIPQPTNLSAEDANLGWVQVVVGLHDDGLAGNTPQLEAVCYTLESDSDTAYTYPSYLRFTKTGEFPDGVLALNRNNQPIIVLNNDVVEFSFGYTRMGGNAEFSLTLRWDWDRELPFVYDDFIVYVQDKQVLYRGVIDKIHTKLLNSKESISLAGGGLSKQLNHVIVNQSFKGISIKNIVRSLLDRYVSDSRGPQIFYANESIADIDTTITDIKFRNETLFEVFTKVASFAGANPTNEGGDGNDIIWGVDEECRFYFHRKVTELEHEFHIGKDISLDDSRVAPKFNTLRLLGYTEGNDMENFILDGNCEKTVGTSDPQLFTQYWLVSDNITVTAVTDPDDVYHGRQAYQFPLSHNDVLSYTNAFRTNRLRLEAGFSYMLSFYAKANTDNAVQLRVGIRLDYQSTSGPDATSVPEQFNVIRTYTLSSSFTKYIAGPFSPPVLYRSPDGDISETDPSGPEIGTASRIEFLPVSIYFTVLETNADESVTLDSIFLHRGDTPIPATHFATIDDHVYEREVFSADGRYEIEVTDWTELNRFGRRKEEIREVDTIETFDDAFKYARAVLGGNATETHRAILTVHTSQELYRPYIGGDGIQWGYAKVFGSTNPETGYEYSIMTAKHKLTNTGFESKLELGAVRPTITEIVRALTARERFRGEGADTTERRSTGGDGGGGNLIVEGDSLVSGGVTLGQVRGVIWDWAEQGNNDRIPTAKLSQPATAAEARAAVSASTRSWSPASIRILVESIAATLTNVNTQVDALVQAWALVGNGNKIPLVKLPDLISQSDAEGGVSTVASLWSAERVSQAIAALSEGITPFIASETAGTFSRVADGSLTPGVGQYRLDGETGIRIFTFRDATGVDRTDIFNMIAEGYALEISNRKFIITERTGITQGVHFEGYWENNQPTAAAIGGQVPIRYVPHETRMGRFVQDTMPTRPVLNPYWATIPDETILVNTPFHFNLNDYVRGITPDPIAIAIPSVQIPAGFTLMDGVLTGMTATPGSHPLTATATNTHGSSSVTFNLIITEATNSPVWSSVTLGEWRIGLLRTLNLHNFVTGTGITITQLSGSLPAGVTFQNGILSGTPTASGSFVMMFRATNAAGNATVTITLDIAAVGTEREYVYCIDDVNNRLVLSGLEGFQFTHGNYGSGAYYDDHFYLMDVTNDELDKLNLDGSLDQNDFLSLSPTSNYFSVFVYNNHFYILSVVPSGSVRTSIVIYDSGGNSVPGGRTISTSLAMFYGYFFNNRFYLVNNTNDHLYLYSTDFAYLGDAMRVPLGTGAWSGGFVYNDYMFVLQNSSGNLSDNNNVFRAFDSSHTRHPERDIRIPNLGSWRGSFVYDNHVHVIATRRMFVFNPLLPVVMDLGDGTWSGGWSYSGRFYLIDNGSNNVRVWNRAGARETTLDFSLGSGNWTDGFAYNDHFFLLDNESNYLRAFNSSNVRVPSMDISLGSGNWSSCFHYNDYFYVAKNDPVSLLVWNNMGTRQSSMDRTSLGVSTVIEGAFPFDDRLYTLASSGAMFNYAPSGAVGRQSIGDILPNNVWAGAFRYESA